MTILKINQMLHIMTLALQFSNKLHICGGLRERFRFRPQICICTRLHMYSAFVVPYVNYKCIAQGKATMALYRILYRYVY